MADDSWDIETVMDFYPCEKPHGMKNYVLEDLTPGQQAKLNVRKREQIRTDQKYLTDHPEIRGLIIMILRLLMKIKPKYNIYEVVGRYFTKPSIDLRQEVNAYLDERAQIIGANSTISMVPPKELSLSVYLEEAGDEFGEEQSEKESVEHEEPTVEGDVEIEEEAAASEELSTSSGMIICREVLQDILENVNEEVDVVSLGSIASVDFPVDYDDHAITSLSDESID